MTYFWRLSSHIEKRLNTLEISSIRDLENTNPNILKRELSLGGFHLWFYETILMEVMLVTSINCNQKVWRLHKYYLRVTC